MNKVRSSVVSAVATIRSRAMLMILTLMLAVPAFAQGEPTTPTLDLDLGPALDTFFSFFGTMFTQLAPVILPIVAIPAAIAFLMMIGGFLRKAFGGLGGGR